MNNPVWTPVWTKDIEKRGAVFTHPGNCYRSGVSFNAALKRYLWSQKLPASKDSRGPRFQGGFGVYDAPEPWGPWTTVYFTEEWDVGPGETSSFPPKWMSADGRSLHLVFSGDDCFSVRQATLTLSTGALKRGASGRLATNATPRTAYFPPPESQGGWRELDQPEEIRRLAGMDPDKLAELKEWLLRSDARKFAAVVIRNGYIVLEVERENSALSDTGNVKSCAKAICATVLALASEESRRGRMPRKMKFDDPAFNFIPWAQPLNDPRKTRITIKQLLNHTSGLAPEATGARNRGPWEYVLGHNGDPLTTQLAFDPGTGLGYSTHGFYHAALVCESVTGKPYDQFAIEALFKPLGIEKWRFEIFDGGDRYERHPSHALGLPARDLARTAYRMLRGGRWQARQVIPKWFVAEMATPTHTLTGRKSFDRDAETWSHG
jgi:CubicO group peptidase (beta-lactamase class C family)